MAASLGDHRAEAQRPFLAELLEDLSQEEVIPEDQAEQIIQVLTEKLAQAGAEL